MQRIFRQSEIKQFLQCRRRWMLSYHRNLTPLKGEVGLADLGTLVHGALAEYYLGRDWSEWVSDQHSLVPTEALPEWKDTYVLLRLMVEGYIEWIEESGQDVGLKAEAIEQDLVVPFGDYLGDAVSISCRVDALIYDEALDLRFLWDHKTVSSLDQASATLQFDFQLLTYSLLLKLSGTPVAGAIHNSLRRVKRTATAKPPFYGRERVSFNDTQLRNHWYHLHGIIGQMVAASQALEAGENQHVLVPPTPTRDCSWSCPFIHVCPMVDDGSNWEGFLSQYYTPRLEHA